jgi:hypothetical protein
MKRGRKAVVAARAASESAPPVAAPAAISGRRDVLAAHAVVTLAIAATFARALPYPLQQRWDDNRFITNNALVQSPSWQAFKDIWSGPHLEAYHPLHLLSYWLDVPWSGGAPLVVHGTQLVIWALAGNALLGLMRALGLRLPLAVLATLACALHPIQVEVVSWASGRKDALAMLFTVLSWLAHTRSTAALDKSAWTSRALYLCAALSKTTALPLPIALFVGDVLLRKRSWHAALVHQLPALGMGVALSTLVLVVWRDHAMIRTTEGALLELPLRVISTFGHQLGSASWPSSLSPLYPTTGLAQPGALAVLRVLAFCALLVLAARAADKRMLSGLIAFVAFMLPVSNAVPMYFPLQDRYLSLPLIGLAFAFFAALEHALRPSALDKAGLVLVLALGLGSVRYQGEWQDELRLWGHATSVQPRAFYALMKLGELRRERGELGGAELSYTRAVALEPNRKLGHAAVLQVRALRDERRHALPSRADAYAKAYFEQLDDAGALRRLAAQMLASGHARALELPLSRSLDLAPLSDAALEQAASAQLVAGRPHIARIYVAHMRAAPSKPELKALAAPRPAR